MGTVSKWINIILEIVEAIIGIHILLKLFHANPNVPFVNWMYRLSAPLLRPFNGIFHDIVFQGKYDLDLSAIFALIIYGIIGYLLILLIGSFGRKSRRR